MISPVINIPISMSILHEQEYNNVSLILKYIKKSHVRRAISEKHVIKKIIKEPRSISIGLNNH